MSKEKAQLLAFLVCLCVFVVLYVTIMVDVKHVAVRHPATDLSNLSRLLSSGPFMPPQVEDAIARDPLLGPEVQRLQRKIAFMTVGLIATFVAAIGTVEVIYQ